MIAILFIRNSGGRSKRLFSNGSVLCTRKIIRPFFVTTARYRSRQITFLSRMANKIQHCRNIDRFNVMHCLPFSRFSKSSKLLAGGVTTIVCAFIPKNTPSSNRKVWVSSVENSLSNKQYVFVHATRRLYIEIYVLIT